MGDLCSNGISSNIFMADVEAVFIAPVSHVPAISLCMSRRSIVSATRTVFDHDTTGPNVIMSLITGIYSQTMNFGFDPIFSTHRPAST